MNKLAIIYARILRDNRSRLSEIFKPEDFSPLFNLPIPPLECKEGISGLPLGTKVDPAEFLSSRSLAMLIARIETARLLPYDKGVNWIYFDRLHRQIPVLKGVMQAKDSTQIFLNLIDDMASRLESSEVFHIGTNHGAITALLARECKNVIGVDILPEAIENTELTLMTEVDELQDKVHLINGDFSLLENLGQKRKYLFFDNPIFKGKINDPNSMAGEDFELPKRAIKMLPSLLEKDGEAFLLIADPINKEAETNMFTLKIVQEYLDSSMPEWTSEKLDYFSEPLIHNRCEFRYNIVMIKRK